LARTHNRISSRIWTGRTARELRAQPSYVRTFQFWLLTNESAIVEPYGLYHVDLDLAVLQIAGGVLRSDLDAAMEILEACDFCEYDHESTYVWIREMAAQQVLENYQPLKERDWRIRAAQKFYDGLPDVQQLGPFFDHYQDLLHLQNRRECSRERGSRGSRAIRPLQAPNPTPTSRSSTPDLLDGTDLPVPDGSGSTALVLRNAQVDATREQFDEWWKLYPVKTGKGKAWAAWLKHKPPFAKAMDTTRAYIDSEEWAPKGDGKKAIPYPATWLNAGSWDDEPTPRGSGRVNELGRKNAAMVDRVRDF
jgi:hypothetical protein